MNYPVWDLAMGGGMLIACVSILHVFISHFAVGGGLWLVLTETRAVRRGDDGLFAYVKGHGRFFILLTLVLGAITGVGIWFTIALVSPQAVSALIHAYVWGWAMEWVFFFIEIAAAIVYYYTWDKLRPRVHLAIGWIYFGAAFMSLVIINGIITFMLTPGDWLQTRAFWDGFFNPTYWPSAVLRTVASLGMAGIFTLLTAVALPRGALRNRVTRYNASWVVAAVVLGALAALWYRSAFPDWNDLTSGSVPVFATVLGWLQFGAIALLALALWALLLPRSWNPVGAVLVIVAGLLVFGSAEWLREAGRKPFTIKDYLYSNGMLVTDEERLAADGVMAHTVWLDPDVVADGDRTAIGEQIYRAHCQVCHTMDGYNGLRPYLARWNRETVAELVPRLQHMRALMPPWHGNEFENDCVTEFLVSEGSRGDAGFPERPEAARGLAWDLSCGLCHTVDGYRPLRESLQGMEADELDELVEMVSEMADEMPPYVAGEDQRELLLGYLARIAGADDVTEETALTGGSVGLDGAILVERSGP